MNTILGNQNDVILKTKIYASDFPHSPIKGFTKTNITFKVTP